MKKKYNCSKYFDYNNSGILKVIYIITHVIVVKTVVIVYYCAFSTLQTYNLCRIFRSNVSI